MDNKRVYTIKPKDFNMLERMADNVYKDLSLPPNLLSLEEFKKAISEMLTEVMFDYEKYNNIIRKRLREYVKLNPSL